jgi:hypothetical protein
MRRGQALSIVAGVDLESFAAGLAEASDEDQGAFFSVFSEALYRNCGSQFKFVTQLLYAKDHMTDRAKEAAKVLAFEEPKS